MRSELALASIASIAWALGACSPSAAPAPPSCTSSDDALVAVSNYTASGVGGFTLGDTGYLEFGQQLYADPALSVSGGRAFYVARDVGLIYELDPRCGTLTGAQFNANYPNPAGTGSANPQDVAVAPDGTLWVPRYNVPSVLAIQPDGGIAHDIDLSPYGPNGSGNPDATAIAIVDVGGVAKAFVALELLDNAQAMPIPYPNTPSLILPIDVATATVGTPIPLVGRNPFGTFVSFGGALWMAEPGTFYSSTEALAGIERFDPQTSTSSLLVHETDLGGSVAQVAITTGCGAAIIADSSAKNLTSLVTFDPVSGAALTTAAKPVFGPTTDYDLQAMLWVGTTLAVGDRTVASNGHYAVHLFDLSSGCTLTQRVPDTVFLQLQPVAFQAALH